MLNIINQNMERTDLVPDQSADQYKTSDFEGLLLVYFFWKKILSKHVRGLFCVP